MGAPQGSALRSLLYIVYVNDMQKNGVKSNNL